MNLEIEEVLENFSRLRVLIVGDVMLDRYIYGKVDRISPEAPVPIVGVHDRESRLGGAANVALNVQSLGAIPILCGLVGGDEAGRQVCALLKESELDSQGIITTSRRRTTLKTRIVSGVQQLVRLDEEDTHKTTEEELKALKTVIDRELPACDAVIFEDYDKGCLGETLITHTVELAKSLAIPSIVDPKARNFFSYRGVTVLKPNLKELREASALSIDPANSSELEKAAKGLQERLAFHQLLVTLSDHGLFYMADDESGRIAAHRRSIADVSGAGDTVVAITALCTAIGLPLGSIATLANLAGGLVCEQPGVVALDKDLLMANYQKLYSS